MTRTFELAAADRDHLKIVAEYELRPDGTHHRLIEGAGLPEAGRKLAREIHRVLGRSLAIREVDTGSCNGCEQEIIALNNPVYDIERFGIHLEHRRATRTCCWSRAR